MKYQYFYSILFFIMWIWCAYTQYFFNDYGIIMAILMVGVLIIWKIDTLCLILKAKLQRKNRHD